ncbi:hypothetical protein HPB50_024444 [Hyalomma asiaticum]|uniref:Uncharacterized protein n=1 Tax=Hyalomma asiaticum TaxID=266040 RepID=A0ACB7T716_HYAAI|nr:hypothetical protein HPB50_024444 [Hyalomma asiaticum]
MWVTFVLENRNDCQVEDEVAVELPEHISLQEHLKRDSVKVSIPLCMLNKLVLAPLESASVLLQTPSDELPAMLRTITCQQLQISQQGTASETLTAALTKRASHSSPSRIIRPDTFYDASDTQEKQRLLRLAEPGLSQSSLASLMIHGLRKCSKHF